MQAELDRSSRGASTAPYYWWIALIAVVGHLPALAGFFAESDWLHLARAAGDANVPALGSQDPMSRWAWWQITWPLLGMTAPAYHAALLLAWSACAVLATRLGGLLGLPQTQAVLAGCLTAASPLAVDPVFWLAHGGSILATLLILASCLVFMTQGRRGLAMAAVPTGLAPLAHPLGWSTGFVLLALSRYRPAQDGSGSRRFGPWPLATLAFGMTGVGISLYGQHFRPVTEILWQVTGLAAWLASPWDFSPLSTGWLVPVGLAVFVGWTAVAWLWPATRRVPAVRVGWILGVTSVLAALVVGVDTTPAVLTFAAVGWCWSLPVVLRELTGWPDETDQPSEAASPDDAPSRVVSPTTWLVLGLLLMGWSWASTHNQLWSRDSVGRLRSNQARSASIGSGVSRLVGQLPLAPDDVTLCVLQTVPDIEGATVDTLSAASGIVNSPIHKALAGPWGLVRMTPPTVNVRWSPHLDGLRRDALVLLDAGGSYLHALGRVENARFYSALIAILAGQHERARHDLWDVTGTSGTRAVFAYRPEILHIDAQRFDLAALGFGQYLRSQESTPERERVLLLFEQLYSTVRERPLAELEGR